MVDYAEHTSLARIKPLPDKYIACDPLPDCENEKDITTFITLWKETKDNSITDAVKQCQVAENVIKSMQNLQGEAQSTFDMDKLEWCGKYIDQLREIELHKYDEITAHIIEYLDTYIKSAEDGKQDRNQGAGKGKAEAAKQDLDEFHSSDDLYFHVWANVAGRSKMHKKILFGNYQSNLPLKQATSPIIFRCLWTSYDYLTHNTIQDDIVVGGILSL